MLIDLSIYLKKKIYVKKDNEKEILLKKKNKKNKNLTKVSFVQLIEQWRHHVECESEKYIYWQSDM